MGLVKQKHPHERGEDAYLNGNEGVELETPPRAWGRPFPAFRHGCACRNTPTSVGKTTRCARLSSWAWKHPHERGEDSTSTTSASRWRETPPRAWGRPEWHLYRGAAFRNTPTSVGKTGSSAALTISSGKHPHERGEDVFFGHQQTLRLETPPRAWGRPTSHGGGIGLGGNTPTSVGKTSLMEGITGGSWKHPHERGEDLHSLTRRHEILETPPRAWGRPTIRARTYRLNGNTPTSVGKTRCWWRPGRTTGKHPHERGEDISRRSSSGNHGETPPRAWGRPLPVILFL